MPQRTRRATRRQAEPNPSPNHQHNDGGHSRAEAGRRKLLELWQDPAWHRRSVRWMARVCGLSQHSVRQILDEIDPGWRARREREGTECQDGRTDVFERPGVHNLRGCGRDSKPPCDCEQAPADPTPEMALYRAAVEWARPGMHDSPAAVESVVVRFKGGSLTLEATTVLRSLLGG